MHRVFLSRFTVRWFSSVLLLLLAVQAGAHNRSESFSEWSWFDGRVSYSFSVLQREATRIPASAAEYEQLDRLLSDYLKQQLSVTSAGQACETEQRARALPSREGYLRVEGSFICSQAQAPRLIINSFFELMPTHTHYAKVRSRAGGASQVAEFLFTKSQNNQQLTASGETASQSLSDWQAFSQYLWIGAEHILGGIDHLVFVLALVLLAAGWREMAWLVTGFTLGHSISLLLAVLGVAQPNSVMVESLIGFTIALVVIESMGERTGQLWSLASWLPGLCLLLAAPVWFASQRWELVLGVLGAGLFALCYLRIVSLSPRPAPLRLVVTTVFGLIHGFGFAGGLLEIGFPADQLAFVLLGFNLGVELGQMMVLSGFVLLMMAARRFLSASMLQWSLGSVAALVSGLGIFWFTSRLLA